MPAALPLTSDLLKSFRPPFPPHSHPQKQTSLHFADTGTHLLATSQDIIHLYDIAYQNHATPIYSKKYGAALARFTHRSGNLIHASTKEENAIRYLGIGDSKYICYYKGHQDLVTSLEINPLNDVFLSAAQNEGARIWDLRSPNCQGMISAGAGRTIVAWHPNGKIFALAQGSAVHLYDIANFDKERVGAFTVSDTLLPTLIEISSISFSNDGRLLLVNTTHGAIYLYWTNGYQELHRLVPLVGGKVSHAILEPDRSGNHYQAAFTPDGCYVMCGSASGDIHVWDTRDGRAVVKYVGHTAPSLVIQCNPRWALFASACKDVAIWTPTEEAIASCSAA